MSAAAWERVLATRPLVIKSLPPRWPNERRQEMVQECFVALYGAALRNPDPWIPYAKVVIRRVLAEYCDRARADEERFDRIEAISDSGGPFLPREEVAAVSGIAGPDRCRSCDRALRTSAEARSLPLDPDREAWKHSYRLCSACAKRDCPRPAAKPKPKRVCVECGDAFRSHQSKKVTCSPRCLRRKRWRRRSQARRVKPCLHCGTVYPCPGKRGLCSDACRKARRSQAKPAAARRCAECYATFWTRHPGKRVCGAVCQRNRQARLLRRRRAAS